VWGGGGKGCGWVNPRVKHPAPHGAVTRWQWRRGGRGVAHSCSLGAHRHGAGGPGQRPGERLMPSPPCFHWNHPSALPNSVLLRWTTSLPWPHAWCPPSSEPGWQRAGAALAPACSKTCPSFPTRARHRAPDNVPTPRERSKSPLSSGSRRGRCLCLLKLDPRALFVFGPAKGRSPSTGMLPPCC